MKTFPDVPPGPYMVTEEEPTGGFVLDGWVCLGPNDTFGLPSPTITADFEVEPGGTTTCTFTNRLVFGPGVEQFFFEDDQMRVVIKLHHDALPEGRVTREQYAGYIMPLIERKNGVLAALGSGFLPSSHDFGALPILVGTIVGQEALDALGIFRLDVERVDLDVGGHGNLADTVPLIDADKWQADGVTGEGVLVAVIDSGVDTDHSDLADDLVFEECFGDNDGPSMGLASAPVAATGRPEHKDDESHGSHVTGIFTSKGTVSSVGVAPDSEVVAIKVLDSLNNFYYYYYDSEILAALNFVIVNKPVAGGSLDVDLINMSLGTNALFDSDCDASTAYNMGGAAAVNVLRAMGVTVFASSGNNGSTTSMSSPACLSDVVSAGATDDFDNVAAFTNTTRPPTFWPRG